MAYKWQGRLLYPTTVFFNRHALMKSLKGTQKGNKNRKKGHLKRNVDIKNSGIKNEQEGEL